MAFVPLARLCPDLDRALTQVIERCLAADPMRRPTAAQLSRTLADVQAGLRPGAER